MKLTNVALFFSFASLMTVALAGCAADAASAPEDAEDVGVASDDLTKAAKDLASDYGYRAADSGAFVDFERLELHADGTYAASVEASLVNPGIRCFRFPCTQPETGTWGTFKSGGKLRVRVRPNGHPSRSYLASKVSDQLTLTRFGAQTVLFQLGGGSSCANVRCMAGTHCEMKGINGGALPVCVKDAPAPACVRSGCSGEVCADEERFTTCQMRPEYACYRSAACERQADGACGFTQTPALAACLAAK